MVRKIILWFGPILWALTVGCGGGGSGGGGGGGQKFPPPSLNGAVPTADDLASLQALENQLNTAAQICPAYCGPQLAAAAPTLANPSLASAPLSVVLPAAQAAASQSTPVNPQAQGACLTALKNAYMNYTTLLNGSYAGANSQITGAGGQVGQANAQAVAAGRAAMAQRLSQIANGCFAASGINPAYLATNPSFGSRLAAYGNSVIFCQQVAPQLGLSQNALSVIGQYTGGSSCGGAGGALGGLPGGLALGGLPH
jgi:hypothetical protein